MTAPAMPAWWPRCPVCQAPVERIETTAKPETTDLMVRFICHGKQDWVVAPRHQAASADVLGSAFQKRAA